ncbi:MAG: glycoside hydrolase family 13 protein [Bacteroidota bacterium]
MINLSPRLYFPVYLTLVTLISCYAKAQGPVPEMPPPWSKGVIWYQIFPDRFCNGDTKNDPPLGAQHDAWPHDTLRPWKLHPWTSDWYKMQPWEKEGGQDIWYNITRRRYGGDLAGILQRLDYLRELGVEAIYLNPIFYAPSHHRYDAYMLHHVDPYLGPDPQGDLAIIAQEKLDDPQTWQWTSADTMALHLVGKVHQFGMRIIWDGVFNHLGVGSPFFQDVIRHQQASAYADWFEVEQWSNPDSGKDFRYKGWFGIQELPEIKENSGGLTEGPSNYVMNITRRWMRPQWESADPNLKGVSLGIDGWRLDVAFCVAHAFWKKWSYYVKSLNPEAYLTAEVIDEAYKLKPYLQGDEFDAVMNYPFAFEGSEFFINDKNRPSVPEFQERMNALVNVFGYERFLSQQNLFGSHDANRIASHIVNRNFARYGDWGDYFSKSKASNPAYNTRKPLPEERRIQWLWTVFQMTFPGAPMLYYGDEVGMWGANDPDCRKPMVWPELNYESEWYRADQSKYSQAWSVEVDTVLWNNTRRLITLRKAYAELSLGEFKWNSVPKSSVLAFERKGDRKTYFYLNPSNSPQPITVDWSKDEVQEVWTGDVHQPTSGPYWLKPYGFAIFRP